MGMKRGFEDPKDAMLARPRTSLWVEDSRLAKEELKPVLLLLQRGDSAASEEQGQTTKQREEYQGPKRMIQMG